MTKEHKIHSSGLLTRLGIFTAIMIVISSMIGSGIFKKIAPMSEQLGSPGLILLAWLIPGIITLFGAAIGLMNIMLVSVTERTSEIGIRKAMGAKTKTIKQQFLFESVLIGQLGGLFGIFLGILIGNMVSLVFGGGFIMPWDWILTGVILCFIVGVVAGYVPATKAASVDPIISLRYE